MATNDDSLSIVDRAMAVDLASEAQLIVYASIPQVEDDPPDLSFEERLARARDLGGIQTYRDGQIEIFLGPACDEAGHEMWEVAVSSCNESDESDETGDTWLYVFLPDDPDDDEVAPIVEEFKPGPWCTHLLTVAHRARLVLADRQGA